MKSNISTETVKNNVVCHISFNHSPFDDRIYWKELLSLKTVGYEAIHIAVGDIDDDYISNEGIRIIIVKRRNPFTRISKSVFVSKALQTIFKRKGTIHYIFKIAAGLKACVYHYHDLQINAISQKLKKLSHKPVVIYDTHEAYHLMIKESDKKRFPENILQKIASLIIPLWEIRKARNCDYIIVTDLFTNSYFNKWLPIVPSKVIYNYSYFLNPQIREKKEYDFIYSGMLSRTRGIKEIIQAIYNCKKFFPNIRLLLIGGFEDEIFKNEVVSFVERLNLQDNIVIKSWVSFPTMSGYYSQSKIGLCILHKTPKYSKAIPIKLFEYMAFSLPVIFSDHGPSAEIIEKENCGMLVKHDDPEGLSNAMKELLSNHSLIIHFGKNGQQAVNKSYNWQKEKDKLLTLYEELLH